MTIEVFKIKELTDATKAIAINRMYVKVLWWRPIRRVLRCEEHLPSVAAQSFRKSGVHPKKLAESVTVPVV